MLKFSLTLFLSAALLTSHAQLAKGKLISGLNLGGSNFSQADKSQSGYYISNYSHKGRSITITPDIGYMLSSKFAAGIALQLGSYINEGKSLNTHSHLIMDTIMFTHSTSTENSVIGKQIGILPYLRYYKLFNERFGIFGEFALGYQIGRGKGKNTHIEDGIIRVGDFTSRTNIYSAMLRSGAVYFLSKKVGIEASFGRLNYDNSSLHSESKNNATSKSSYSTLGLQLGLSSLTLGAKVYL